MAVVAEQVARTPLETVLVSEPHASIKVPSVEEFVGELLTRIQPARASEERRRTVAQYVQDIIARAFQPAFEVKAFIYGSVPLKTYLPDGDIDLAVFQNNKGLPQHLRDSWFTQLSSFLQREEHNPGAPYRIRDVQVIHAEVKLVKCLVDNIVVDISYQSLGGLCTVNFLESIDRRIDDHHLFKRSIILVKAWCYYESRLLGAHHGLISTYALETMVLYIFMVYHKSVTSPLKVLHKFLTVFSSFDWDRHCLSLQGPIPLTTFPDPKPLPFPDSDGPPLLKEDFMADMRHMYSPPVLSPDGGAPTPRSFQLKFLNIMDPLLPTNNLGRSVNRSSFARIRRALEYGAKRLTSILNMDVMEGADAARAFFRNTWNAQRSHGPLSAKTPSPVWKPAASSDGMRPHSAAPKASQPPPGGMKMPMHMQPAAGIPNGWHPVQVPQMLGLPVPQLVSSTTTPLLLQQQQLQQLMIQIGQQHMHQGQTLYNNLLQAGADPALRKFARANSQPSLADHASLDPRLKNQHPRQGQGTPAELQASSSQESGLDQNASSHLRHLLHADGLQKPQPPARPSTAGFSSAQRSGGTPQSSPPQAQGSIEDKIASGWREQMQGRMPGIGFLPVSTSGQSRMVPALAAMHVQTSRVGDYYPMQYPLLLPNASVPMALRGVPSNGFHPVFTSVPAALNTLGSAPQRHSDPGTPINLLELTDATLSGDLERLSQHLQSARAMFDSNASPSSQRSTEPYPGRYPDGGGGGSYRQYGGGSYGQGLYSKGPTRSSSAGNLNHLRSTSYPNMRRPLRPDASGSTSLPLDTQISYPPFQYPVNGSGQRPRFPARQHVADVQVQRPAAASDLAHQESRSVPGSDRAPSQPPSPTGKCDTTAGPLQGPTPVIPGPVPEWPLPGVKGRALAGDYPAGADPGRAGWSTASEGRPGWTSPVGSTVSEQSLASLRALRLSGASPAPVSPSFRGASVKSAQSVGSTEGQSTVPLPPDEAKQWRDNFVLAEEDFPTLASATPQNPSGPLSSRSSVKPASWLGDGKRGPSTA